jgi:phthalate 4,5-dioxygenase oxygenase subunit
MGPKEKQPPFPEFEWTKLPRSHRYVTKFVEQCNYLQAMEGDYDPGHGMFLHSKLDGSPQGQQFNVQVRPRIRPTPADEPYPQAVGPRRQTESDKKGWGRVEDSDSGVFFIQSAERQDGTKVAQVAPWMMPIYCTAGTTGAAGTYSSNMRIPIDNESLMFYRLRWSFEEITDDQLAEYKNGGYSHPELIPGSWMPKANLQNDYMIDRVAQKTFSYSGIKTFPLQDIALIEAQWGPIAKRENEHLVSADYMIIHVRQRLLKAAKDMRNGIEPEGPFHPEVFRIHRENAIGNSEEEALEAARAKAMAAQLPERMPAIAAG